LPEIGDNMPMVVARDLFNVLGPKITHVDVQTSYGAATTDIALGGDRTVKLSASRALETERQHMTGKVNRDALSDPAVDFHPFAHFAFPTTVTAIQANNSYRVASELHEYGAQVAGPIVSSNAGAMTGALGAEYRVQMFRTCDSTLTQEPCARYG